MRGGHGLLSDISRPSKLFVTSEYSRLLSPSHERQSGRDLLNIIYYLKARLFLLFQRSQRALSLRIESPLTDKYKK